MDSRHTDRIAQFVSATRYEDIPERVLHCTKRLILDTMGNAIAGYSTAASKRALKTVAGLGGAPQSTIVATGHRTSLTNAVFSNVTLAATLEADDCCLYLGHHGHVSIFPALALGEQRRLPGKAFLAACAVAYEASARIASAARHVVRDNNGALKSNPSGGGVNWAIFASAFSAAQAVGLNMAQVKNLMGLAGFNASIPTGSRWNRPPFSNLKYNPYAFLGQSGMLAALLAENGFTGDDAILDVEGDAANDWWHMAGIAGADPAAAFASLGDGWLTLNTSFKPYPGCRFTQGPATLFEALLREKGIRDTDIEHVDIYTDGMIFQYKMNNPCVESEEDAQFSLPHIMSMVALKIKPGADWVAPRFWNNPTVESLKSKIVCHRYDRADSSTIEQLLDGRWERYPHRIVVQACGQTFERHADYVLGDPHVSETYLSDERLFEKFRSFTEQRIAANQVDRCIETVMSLDQLGDLSPFVECLC
jgi:2-methylcitrate dehydratase PrpD